MSKIISLGLLLIAAAGVFLYIVIAQDPAADQVTNQPAVSSVPEQSGVTLPDEAPRQSTLADLFEQTENARCTFTSVDEVSSSEGTFWFAGEQYALEALTRVDGELYAANMIQTEGQLYIWSGTAEGMMAIVMQAPDSIDELSESETEVEGFGQGVDLNQTVSYQCEPWTPNQLRFTPPTDINFVDMEAMMEGMFEGQLRGMPEGLDIPVLQ